MYADDLLLSRGRLSAAKGTVTLSVGCRLNWYRALPVSCVQHLALTVDGTRLIPDAIVVELGGRRIPAPALVEHDDCEENHPVGATPTAHSLQECGIE